MITQYFCDGFMLSSVTGRWSDEETEQLLSAVNEFADPSDGEERYNNLNWHDIAVRVPTRNADQCRNKW